MYPHGTCETCKTITLAALKDAYKDRLVYSPHHLLLQYPSLLSSAKSCRLCAIIFKQIQICTTGAETGMNAIDFTEPVDFGVWTQYLPSRSEPAPENLRIADVRIFMVRQKDKEVYQNCNFRAYADEGSHASKWIIARPVPPMRSPETLSQVQKWLRQCAGGHPGNQGETGHGGCSLGLSGEVIGAETVLPTRLVDVSGPRLCVTAGQRGQYTVLSHRWGAKDPLTTTQSNIESHMQGISATRLPKTFRDAIELTANLGIRYIWIDSLCIVQDDADDWAAESKQMGAIYERSHLCIAATSSLDGDGGLFRDTTAYDRVQFPCGSDPGYMYFTNLSTPTGFPMTDMEHGPLNTRGWVFQERALSRRILHFMPAQLYWECLGGLVCQSGLERDCDAMDEWHRRLELSLRNRAGSLATTHAHPDHPLRLGPDPDPGESHLRNNAGHIIFHRAWERALCYYSTRALTFASDRLVALHGVMERLQKRTGYGCVLGHWSDSPLCFIKSLVWAVAGPPYSRPGFGPDDQVPRVSRHPTWTWVGRPIYYPQDGFWPLWRHIETPGPFGILLDPPGLKPDGEPAAVGCDNTDQGRTLSLGLTGSLNTGVRGPPLDDPFVSPAEYQFAVRTAMVGDYERAFALVDNTTAQNVLGWVRFDSAVQQPRSFWCCPMFAAPAGIPVLTLEKTALDGNQWKRIGIGMICGWRRGGDELDRDAVASWLDCGLPRSRLVLF